MALTSEAEATARASASARLWIVGACALCLAAAVVGFDLLYLHVPKGWAPAYGFAPGVRKVYPHWLWGPGFALNAKAFASVSVALQVAMWGAFFAAVALLRKLEGGPGERQAFKLVVAAALATSLALILAPPTLSPDLYHYALFGRMIITRGLNPYVTPAGALAGDPLWVLANWQEYSTHYGPVFTGLSVVAAAVGAGSPIGTALAFKTMAVAFGALAAWSVSSLARQQQRSNLVPVALVAWNPLVMLETAGSGHNDMVMMGLALAGLAVAGRGRPHLGFALLVCSAHVKWVTAALLGLVVIARLREVDGLGARARELAKLGAIAAGITVAIYLPFWRGLDSITATRKLIVEGHGGRLRVVHLILFTLIVGGAIAVTARWGRRYVLEMAALVCMAFVVLVFPWMFPWYLIPTLVLLAVGPPSRVNVVLFMIATALSIYLMGHWAVSSPP